MQTVGHDGVWMGRRVEMTRVGMGNVHGLKTKWVQVEESVSRKGGVLLIVVADHFISGIEPDSRSRCRCSRMSQRRHGRIRSAKDYIRLFPAISRFPAFRPCLKRAGAPVATAPTPSVLVVAAGASMSLPVCSTHCGRASRRARRTRRTIKADGPNAGRNGGRAMG